MRTLFILLLLLFMLFCFRTMIGSNSDFASSSNLLNTADISLKKFPHGSNIGSSNLIDIKCIADRIVISASNLVEEVINKAWLPTDGVKWQFSAAKDVPIGCDVSGKIYYADLLLFSYRVKEIDFFIEILSDNCLGVRIYRKGKEEMKLLRISDELKMFFNLPDQLVYDERFKRRRSGDKSYFPFIDGGGIWAILSLSVDEEMLELWGR